MGFLPSFALQRCRLVFAVGAVALLGALRLGAGGPAVAYRAGAWEIEVTLEPDQPAIMLGEPTWLSFRVRNLSEDNLRVIVGGDYRNALGRPDSFKVRTVDRDGRLVAQPSAGFDMGGLSGPEELPAKGIYVFRLFLPHWATFQEPGSYRVTCNKTLRLLKASSERDWFEGKKIEVDTEVEATLNVTPRDDHRMAGVIDAFASSVFQRDRNAGEFALQALCAIDDPRVVPHLCRVIAVKSYSLQFRALEALAKFDSDEALAGLRAGLATTAQSIKDEANRPESLANNLRHAAAVALSRSRHPHAQPLLLAQRHDPVAAVRLTVLHVIGTMPATAALPLLQEMAKDPDTMVREEAKRYLELASAGKKS